MMIMLRSGSWSSGFRGACLIPEDVLGCGGVSGGSGRWEETHFRGRLGGIMGSYLGFLEDWG